MRIGCVLHSIDVFLFSLHVPGAPVFNTVGSPAAQPPAPLILSSSKLVIVKTTFQPPLLHSTHVRYLQTTLGSPRRLLSFALCFLVSFLVPRIQSCGNQAESYQNSSVSTSSIQNRPQPSPPRHRHCHHHCQYQHHHQPPHPPPLNANHQYSHISRVEGRQHPAISTIGQELNVLVASGLASILPTLALRTFATIHWGRKKDSR